MSQVVNRRRGLLAWFFTDAQGRQTLVRPPNAPILAAGVLFGVSHLSKTPVWRQLAFIGSVVCLLAWALLELITGRSPFRRVLGAVVATVLFLRAPDLAEVAEEKGS